MNKIPGARGFAAFVTGLIGIVVMIMTPLAHIARAQKISVILAREQEPFWMTGGSIALSNLGTAPPAEAKWWWSERIRHRLCATHRGPLSIDAFTDEPIWQDPALCSGTGNEFSASRAAEILKDFLETPRYRQMVRSFSRLASLETDLTELEKLKAEAEQGLADVVVYVREGAYLTDSEVEQLLEFNHAPPFWPDYWIQTNSYPKTNVVFWISKDGRYSMDITSIYAKHDRVFRLRIVSSISDVIQFRPSRVVSSRPF